MCIRDRDERPRTDTEGNWLLTILRIPVVNKQNGSLPFDTVPVSYTHLLYIGAKLMPATPNEPGIILDTSSPISPLLRVAP